MSNCKDCEYFFVSNYFTTNNGELLVCCCENKERFDGEGYLENLQTCNMFKKGEMNE